MTAMVRATTDGRIPRTKGPQRLVWRTEGPLRLVWRTEGSQRSAGRRTWAATAWLVAGTIAVAVTSYSLSLQVASERRDVERLARQNRSLQSDLKALDAELRVRMRMPQLQRWNDSVLGMVPISATQYLAEPVQLAAYGTAPAAPAQPRVQLAVRDLAPEAAPAAARPVLVRVQAPAVAAAPGPIARPAAEAAPADLLQQVELSFGDQQTPQP
jgi:hypothetical protein